MSVKGISLQEAKKMSGEEREQLIGLIEKEAYDNEVSYWGCGQAVLDALQRYLNLGGVEAFKAASGLAGGVGRMREACGALIGGVMAIGLAYGRAKFEPGKICFEQADYREAEVRSTRFCERFREEFGGHIRCEDVKAFVRRGDESQGYFRFDTIEAFENHAKCGNVCGPAARFAAEIMLEPTESFKAEMDAELEDIMQVRRDQKNRIRKTK